MSSIREGFADFGIHDREKADQLIAIWGPEVVVEPIGMNGDATRFHLFLADELYEERKNIPVSRPIKQVEVQVDVPSEPESPTVVDNVVVPPLIRANHPEDKMVPDDFKITVENKLVHVWVNWPTRVEELSRFSERSEWVDAYTYKTVALLPATVDAGDGEEPLPFFLLKSAYDEGRLYGALRCVWEENSERSERAFIEWWQSPRRTH